MPIPETAPPATRVRPNATFHVCDAPSVTRLVIVKSTVAADRSIPELPRVRAKPPMLLKFTAWEGFPIIKPAQLRPEPRLNAPPDELLVHAATSADVGAMPPVQPDARFRLSELFVFTISAALPGAGVPRLSWRTTGISTKPP